MQALPLEALPLEVGQISSLMCPLQGQGARRLLWRLLHWTQRHEPLKGSWARSRRELPHVPHAQLAERCGQGEKDRSSRCQTKKLHTTVIVRGTVVQRGTAPSTSSTRPSRVARLSLSLLPWAGGHNRRVRTSLDTVTFLEIPHDQVAARVGDWGSTCLNGWFNPCGGIGPFITASPPEHVALAAL